jgi:hypothetical protein
MYCQLAAFVYNIGAQTYPFVTLDTLGHLSEVVVVGSIHITKVPNFVSRFQAGGFCWTSCSYGVDFGKRRV